MTYIADTFSAGEQPNTAKLNELWGNDAHFYTFLGDNLAWQSWTPTWTNLTVGNGTANGTSTRVGKLTVFRYQLVLGTTSAVGTNPIFTLPSTSVNYGTAGAQIIGEAHFLDFGVAAYIGSLRWKSTTTAELVHHVITTHTGTVPMQLAQPTASTPFAFGSTDIIGIQGFYEAA